MSQIRLDKWLADAGVGTRSQVKEYLKKGRVRVNGEPVKKPETRISEETDEVSFDGEILSRRALPGICSTSRRAASRQRETAGPRPSWLFRGGSGEGAGSRGTAGQGYGRLSSHHQRRPC